MDQLKAAAKDVNGIIAITNAGVQTLHIAQRLETALDYLGEFQCCFYRLFSPRSVYSRRYTRSELVLAVSVDDILQPAL